MRRSYLPAVLVVGLGLPWLVQADAPRSPLDAAQVEARRSATVRLAALDEGDLGARLQAIRATPFDPVPEAALLPLARIAAGRDAALAPAAAVAAYRIADSLSRASFDAHESDPEELVRAKQAFTAIAQDGSARADLRRLAGYVASALSSL